MEYSPHLDTFEKQRARELKGEIGTLPALRQARRERLLRAVQRESMSFELRVVFEALIEEVFKS